MDIRDTLKFLSMTMAMTAGVLYSYGLFKLPWIESNKNQAADISSKAGDNRTDGGTAKVSQSIAAINVLSNSDITTSEVKT